MSDYTLRPLNGVWNRSLCCFIRRGMFLHSGYLKGSIFTLLDYSLLLKMAAGGNRITIMFTMCGLPRRRLQKMHVEHLEHIIELIL